MHVWKVIKTVLLLLASCVIVIFGYFAAWTWYDVRSVEAFCKSVRPGAPYSSLLPLAKASNVDPHFISPGVADEEHHDWVSYVTAPSTLGDTSCEVHYSPESRTILSASMLYLP